MPRKQLADTARRVRTACEECGFQQKLFVGATLFAGGLRQRHRRGRGFSELEWAPAQCAQYFPDRPAVVAWRGTDCAYSSLSWVVSVPFVALTWYCGRAARRLRNAKPV